MAAIDDRFADIEEGLVQWQEKLDAADVLVKRIQEALEVIQPRMAKLEADLATLQARATKAKLI